MQVSGHATLEEDDEVSFEAGVHVATGARKATSVRLLAKANDSAVRRELGQVSKVSETNAKSRSCEAAGC